MLTNQNETRVLQLRLFLIQSSKRCPKAVSEISKYIYIKDLGLHFRHHGLLVAPSYYVCQFLHAPTDAYFSATKQNESRDIEKFTKKVYRSSNNGFIIKYLKLPLRNKIMKTKLPSYANPYSAGRPSVASNKIHPVPTNHTFWSSFLGQQSYCLVSPNVQ